MTNAQLAAQLRLDADFLEGRGGVPIFLIDRIRDAANRLTDPLPDESAEMIERLRSVESHGSADTIWGAAAALIERLSRAPAAPLPDDVAKTTQRLREVGQDFLLDVAFLLERMARREQSMAHAITAMTMARIEERKRIRELEADLKQHAELNAAEHQFMLQAQDAAAMWKEAALGRGDVAAIRARTIEECLSRIPGGNICDPQKIADSIRALSQPESGKE